ncbi:carbonic anhydrase-like [Gouania willdenowi]|uniref:Carbonic anhydrase n=1 Tax=Gouania willdenowi TaxID=441366 RepID=A0A8C5N8E5_GOUWI|nr:carbonic anhydrase-like [Gouania willdenowi]
MYYIISLLLSFSLAALVQSSSDSEWCYSDCSQTPEHWKDIDGSFCGGTKQSPIDIDTSKVEMDPDLHNFTFVNFSSRHVVKSGVNNGHTVKFILEEGAVEISGGGLNGTYTALQLHFHWGQTEHHAGSEHTINGHRYPMEMHIVTVRKGLSVEQALNHSEGIAAFGFFITGTEHGDMLGHWSTLTSHLTKVGKEAVELNLNISIDDLTANVDRTKFYRYRGSLTTPNCNEVLVWTVFQQPIEIDKNLIQMFPDKAGYSNTFRPTEHLNARKVYSSPATSPSSEHWCYDSHCQYSPSHWYLMPGSKCGGDRQSPVNIDTQRAETNDKLTEFKFTNFDNKHAIKYMTNTGHTVKCVLEDNMVEVSGGGLGYVYTTLQFHFHWGSHSSGGSEHTMDSVRYPMEMHIVNMRKDLNLTQAINTPNGLAVLGFFIEAERKSKNSGGSSEHESTHPTPSSSSTVNAWERLSSYLPYINNINSKVNVTKEISIDDLLGEVDRKSYYRYNGSLTTPQCNEAVVWTVFEDTVKMDHNWMEMFPTHAGYHNVFRPTTPLNKRTIFKSSADTSAPVFFVLLACFAATFI